MKLFNIVITAVLLSTIIAPVIATEKDNENISENTPTFLSNTSTGTNNRRRKLRGSSVVGGKVRVSSISPEQEDIEDMDDSHSRQLKGKNSVATPTTLDWCSTGGFYYYKVETFSQRITWDMAYDATPQGCILAPVSNANELEEIRSVVGSGMYPWIGIMKNAAQAKIDTSESSEEGAALTGWKNLDGTNVPVDQGLWAENEPLTNVSKPKNRAMFPYDKQGLSDVQSCVKSQHAVYKCCGNLDTAK